MRVLLVEDDAATAQSIELMLESENMNVYTTDLGAEGVDLGKLYDYDIILLDLNLPDMSELRSSGTLRQCKIATPIMIVSGLAGIQDRVMGLNFGADADLTKPFHKDELVARIHAIVRRSRSCRSPSSRLALCWLISTRRSQAPQWQEDPPDQQGIPDAGAPFAPQGVTLTKEMMLNHLYGGRDEPDVKIIDVFIWSSPEAD